MSTMEKNQKESVGKDSSLVIVGSAIKNNETILRVALTAPIAASRPDEDDIIPCIDGKKELENNRKRKMEESGSHGNAANVENGMEKQQKSGRKEDQNDELEILYENLNPVDKDDDGAKPEVLYDSREKPAEETGGYEVELLEYLSSSSSSESDDDSDGSSEEEDHPLQLILPPVHLIYPFKIVREDMQ